MHVCLSGDPSCSGLLPCQFCWDTIKQRILPRAMVATDQQVQQAIFTHPQLGAIFLEAFIESWRSIQQEAEPHLKPTATQPTLNAQEESQPAESAKPEPQKLPDGTELVEVDDVHPEGQYVIEPDRLKGIVDKLNKERTQASKQTEQTLASVATAELAEATEGSRVNVSPVENVNVVKTPSVTEVESTQPPSSVRGSDEMGSSPNGAAEPVQKEA